MSENVNAWLQEELYQEYLNDRATVDESWKQVFEGRPAPAAGAPSAPPDAPPADWQPLRGPAGRIVQNMQASLSVPTATSQRTIPVKVVDENRTIINQHRTLVGQSKVSYTHLIGWAIVQAIRAYPNLNNAYAEQDGQPFRALRPEINLGVAVDVASKDGGRMLTVPNIKNTGALNFQQFLAAYDDVVARARTGKLALEDFQGTSISLGAAK